MDTVIHQRFDRRLLNFPAVHPCEGISPKTLLGSLINLSRSICNYQSKFFQTQRRNARETIRQIGILTMFCEEIRDQGLSISDSVVLCFSELHISFQKLLFLLEDCSREGARFWILMKAHFVATQFQVFFRSIATALDILPLVSMEVSGEIKELVEMVTKQARKAKLELDPDDEEAMKRVILILNQFENRVEPDPNLIGRVLDHLDIRSWSECQKEIKFLDEEMSMESLEGDEREMPLSCSLIGFLSYCRGVIFGNSEFETAEQSDDRSYNLETLSYVNPADFRCPISLELMTDPVTVSTGQTYDRASIQKWFKSGNLTCPKTGAELKSKELVPNTSLRKLIQQFCTDNGISLAKSRKKSRDISRTIVPGSPSAAGAIHFLSEYLVDRLYYGTPEVKNRASYEIRLLAKSSIFNRSCLIEAGTIPFLINLLNLKYLSCQENAIAALLKLSKHSSGKRIVIVNGGLKPILEVLKNGVTLESKQIAAATIFYLSSVPEYRKLIGETRNAIPALTELIKTGTTCGKKNAVVALFGLLLHHRNHEKILEAGTIPVLVEIVGSCDKSDLVTDSLALLDKLAERTDGSIAILQTSALQLVLNLLQSLSSRTGKEYCASILLSLCVNCGGEVVAILAKNGSLMSCLYSLLTDGTANAGKKSRLLIKLLQKFQESESSCSSANPVSQDQFIHVR